MQPSPYPDFRIFSSPQKQLVPISLHIHPHSISPGNSRSTSISTRVLLWTPHVNESYNMGSSGSGLFPPTKCFRDLSTSEPLSVLCWFLQPNNTPLCDFTTLCFSSHPAWTPLTAMNTAAGNSLVQAFCVQVFSFLWVETSGWNCWVA